MRKHFYISCLLLIGIGMSLTAQEEWAVPQDRKGRLSPFEFSEDSKTKGLSGYTINCASCHGQPGVGNYQRLTPSPGDPASSGFQMNLDGELFYKVMEGREQMPSFKAILSQDEIWEIISYIRSFNPNYVHAYLPSAERSAYGGMVTIALTHLKDRRKIEAKVTGERNGAEELIVGADVVLRVKRYFGNLMVDEPKTTNEDGVVLFDEPGNIPGDADGNIQITAQLANQDLYGVTKVDTTLAVGKSLVPVSLTQERAMWNTVKKAPIWLLITFSLAVILAWGTIFYIIHQLKRISDIGSKHTSTHEI